MTTTTHATDKAILAEHTSNHVGHTALRGCPHCVQDHKTMHRALSVHTHIALYDDCQLCEDAWYAEQNSNWSVD